MEISDLSELSYYSSIITQYIWLQNNSDNVVHSRQKSRAANKSVCKVNWITGVKGNRNHGCSYTRIWLYNLCPCNFLFKMKMLFSLKTRYVCFHYNITLRTLLTKSVLLCDILLRSPQILDALILKIHSSEQIFTYFRKAMTPLQQEKENTWTEE